MKFTVLIPVYYGDKLADIKEAVDSIINQSLKPTEILIICDGKIDDEIASLLDKYYADFPDLFSIIKNEAHRGLSYVLAQGVKLSKYDIIARMDADDIAGSDRFEQQIPLIHSGEFDVVGSNISEFNETVGDISSIRTVPLTNDDIYSYAKKRNPFNHMTVVFNRQSVLDAGNYMDYSFFEDYHLWVRMIQNGCRMMNVDGELVHARIGNDMHKRRGGHGYVRCETSFFRDLYKRKFIGGFQFISNMCIRTLVRIMPVGVRKLAYSLIRRK